MRHSMKPDLRADYKIRLYTGPKTPFFEVSTFIANPYLRVVGQSRIEYPGSNMIAGLAFGQTHYDRTLQIIDTGVKFGV